MAFVPSSILLPFCVHSRTFFCFSHISESQFSADSLTFSSPSQHATPSPCKKTRSNNTRPIRWILHLSSASHLTPIWGLRATLTFGEFFFFHITDFCCTSPVAKQGHILSPSQPPRRMSIMHCPPPRPPNGSQQEIWHHSASIQQIAVNGSTTNHRQTILMGTTRRSIIPPVSLAMVKILPCSLLPSMVLIPYSSMALLVPLGIFHLGI